MRTKIKYISLALLGFIAPSVLFAQESAAAAVPVPYIDSGNTAWMMVATALVMLMTIPGLALFYGGLVRQKNILNILMQCFVLTAVITLEWVFFGYSLAFSSSAGVLSPYIGGFDWVFLNGIGINDVSPYYISQETARIPHLLFVLFQGMFAVITPALIIGAYAERIQFRGFLIFSILWAILVYNPVAHWVWSADGWLYNLGALDFAGGTVVHINAGIAAFVMTLMVGSRKNYNNHPTAPHNIPLVVIGTALLWFGWFGFNAGSGLAADGLAISAFLSTHVAAATAALTWALLDWTINKRPTVIGICTGAVAGLVAITPAAGFVGILGAVVIGILVSLVCFFMVSVVKHKYGYDDSLDAFGVHGIGGIVGALATGLLATPAIQSSYSGLFYGNPKQLWIQIIATVTTMVFSGLMTYILFKVVDKFFGIRATMKDEIAGLDISQHNEMAYTESD
ncbi:MAG TPA: ammonium transporter [Prolixibacteraceae bacterium]|nr:ammonium transporter [Prolixibacteraceae bacterium]